MKHIDALATLLGLDAPPTLTLSAHEQHYLQGYIAALRTDASRLAGGVPVLPATAPLEPSRRLMLDGMLAGLLPEPGCLMVVLLLCQRRPLSRPWFQHHHRRPFWFYGHRRPAMRKVSRHSALNA